MKRVIFLILMVLPILLNFKSKAYGKQIPISVTEFTDKTGDPGRCNYGWLYWQNRMGSAFQEMLITELVKDRRLMVLERGTINKIYEGEHNLVNSKNDTKTLKRESFKKAKYTIVGSTSEFEFCAEKDDTGVDVGVAADLIGIPNPFGSVKVKSGGAKAKAVIDLRVINVETGEVIASVTKEGNSENKNFSLDSNIFDKKSENSQPIAQAAREAIRKAADEIKPMLN
ncbi:MAG: CsgG/HfaB family protein [Bdellovibrionales bacterium]